jgi:hypothetical protein
MFFVQPPVPWLSDKDSRQACTKIQLQYTLLLHDMRNRRRNSPTLSLSFRLQVTNEIRSTLRATCTNVQLLDTKRSITQLVPMSLQSQSIGGLLSEVSMVMCVDVAGDQPTDRTSSTQSWCDYQSHLAGSQETWVRNGRWILLTKHLYSCP